MKKLLAVCLMALVCWVCAGYAEETRVGDTVIFGQYEQDGNLDNGSEPIAWLVLDVQGGKALLMSRYALDCLPFHDEKTDAAWNQSALNAWLQADFRAAFTDAEWAAIAPVTLADTAAEMPQKRLQKRCTCGIMGANPQKKGCALHEMSALPQP